MDKNNSVTGLLGASMEKIKEMVDANTVIGTPINAADGTILTRCPGFPTGLPRAAPICQQGQCELFGGGSGAGINITPIAFLVIANGDVKLLQLVSKPDSTDRLVNLVPDLVDKVTGLFKKDKDKEKTEGEETDVQPED